MSAIPLRTWRERWVQVLLFEAGGLAVVTPLYRWVTGEAWGESLGLLALLSLIATLWQAGYNAACDALEARWAKRPAHLRPWQWRAVHALGFEVTLFLITWPVIVLWTGWTWWAAAVADLGLALAYTAYAFLYHWLFDRWRPVAAERGA
ncbi:MAG TPA: PACE efflux transporter [Hydrogenophilus thermoluteolus]|nr:PACE efflux transporter [Hydrogenophilus thermoluteolus]